MRPPPAFSFPPHADAFHDEFYPYAAGCAVADDDARLLLVYSDAREESGVECEATGALFARVMEIEFDAPGRLPVPVLVFTARPVGGNVLDGAAVEEHGEVTDVAWFDAEALPADLRAYEATHEYLRSLDG